MAGAAKTAGQAVEERCAKWRKNHSGNHKKKNPKSKLRYQGSLTKWL
jgi:hypothetical protein